MAAYMIVDVEVLDPEPEPYEEYRKQVQATMDPYGGRFIVRGGNLEVIEGDWRPTRLVVLEFPSLQHARDWYASPAYQQILPIRLGHACTDAVFVEGV